MIATFIIDWPVVLAIGLLFGGWAPARPFESKAFRFGAAVAAVFTSTALISYFIAPDWMWMYFIDPSDAAWVVPIAVIGYLFTYVVGFAAGSSIRRASELAHRAAVASALLMEIAVVGLTWDRYHLIGSAQEWSTGRAHELFALDATGPARTIGLLCPIFLVALAAGIYLVRRGRAPASSR